MEKLEAEQNKKPKIIYKVDEKRLEELNKKIGEQDTKLEELENEKLEIEEKLKKAVEQTKDYKELKAELEEKKNELTALTQEQIRLKNRRIIYNHASKVTQDIGKTKFITLYNEYSKHVTVHFQHRSENEVLKHFHNKAHNLSRLPISLLF